MLPWFLVNFHILNLKVAVQNISDKTERNCDCKKRILNLGVIRAIDQDVKETNLYEHRIDDVNNLYGVLDHHWVVQVWK